MTEEKDVGVVINGILFRDDEVDDWVDKPFVWGKEQKPNVKAIKAMLIAQGHAVYKWPSEKDKIKAIISLPLV